MGNILSTVPRGSVGEGDSLQLVLSILPLVGDLSKRLADEVDKSEEFHKSDKRYGYLGNIQTSVGLLRHHLELIEKDGDTHLYQPQINRLADCLEEIFGDQVFKRFKLNHDSEHPRLQAVQQIASTSDEPHTEDFLNTSMLENLDAWNNLQHNLESLTDELERHGDNVDDIEHDLPAASQEPDMEAYGFVNRVLDAVHCNCDIKSERELRLRIGTYRNGKSSLKPESLNVLVAEKLLLDWRELLIHNKPQSREKSNSRQAEHSTTQARAGYSQSSENALCICDYLKAHTRSNTMRLDVVLDDDVLRQYGLPPAKREFVPESLQEEVDLKSLLSFQAKTWTEASKLALAVILAYGLFYLYGGSRVKGRWRRENILFFTDKKNIPLRPFLGISVSQSSVEAAEDKVIYHRHPEILELGVILLEIYLGQRLESFLQSCRDLMTVNDFYWGAWEVYEDKKLQIMSLEYRKAIEACLAPGTFANAESDGDISTLRSVLFQSIVQPLEKALAGTCQALSNPVDLDVDDLDEEAAKKCDLESKPSSNDQSTNSSRFVQHRRDHLPAISHYEAEPAAHIGPCRIEQRREISVKDPKVFGKEGNQGTDVGWKKTVGWKNELQARKSAGMLASEWHPAKIVSPIAMLSDAKERTDDKRMRSGWTKWLKDFEVFRQQILPDAVDPENQQRVRVTVIDTGIDGLHPYIQSMGWRSYDENAKKHLFRDFVEPNPARGIHDPIDEDGHGTFIAGLLLQLAPDIELSVARIGSTRKSIQNDSQVGKKIGRAIEHAIQTWDTDIISISFGSENTLSDVCDAIDKARRREKEIIILAAAGNSGNCRGTSFPASEDRVFKIFAANSDGYKADFNPPTYTNDQNYSYFILGCGVVSTWPSSLRKKAEDEKLEIFCCCNLKEGNNHSEDKCDTRTVMSGTSFATPIASALVAIIYQFHDANKELPSRVKLKEESEDRFKTPKAVRLIFTKMSRRSPGAPYNVLAPATGKDDYFLFCSEPGNDYGLNIHGDTHIEFFSKKLAGALWGQI